MGSPISIHTDDGKRTGHVKVFKQSSGGWELNATIHGGADLDRFGSSVALSESGLVVAISADRSNALATTSDIDVESIPNKSFVEVYEDYDNGTWSIVDRRLYGSDCLVDERFHEHFGRDVSLSNDGNVLAVSRTT